jgi:hypothetical protein
MIRSSNTSEPHLMRCTASGSSVWSCSARGHAAMRATIRIVDVAVFLRDITDRFAEMDRLADLGTDILNKTGEFVHAMPYRAGSYDERTPLMLAVRSEGIDL